ncbi:uncharacterized protein TNCV_2065521 [Trichonephila clavipes]|nr:uncharacterized protein TNCV_2065521 [Trichonephila clavipes]
MQHQGRQEIAQQIYFVDNMLTKYQMITFIEFYEVWFLPESVARVAVIVGDHSCNTSRHLFKETLYVFLGYSRTNSFHTLPKLIFCGSWGCNLVQSLSNHRPHVFYLRKIRRASRPGKQFNLVIQVKTISFHSATHILLSSHHWRRRRVGFCVKGRPRKERLADRPLCCKWRQMVRAETE